jgi:hypothetical protein
MQHQQLKIDPMMMLNDFIGSTYMANKPKPQMNPYHNQLKNMPRAQQQMMGNTQFMNTSGGQINSQAIPIDRNSMYYG